MGREELVRLHGADPIAYSTLQPGLHYLDASFGYIAYQRVLGMDITLGPPVCAPGDRRALLSRFLRERPRPIFCYVQKDCACLLREVGPRLRLAGMGVDRLVSLPQLATPTQELRGARKKAARAGFSIEPTQLSTLDEQGKTRLREITAAYLSHSQLPYEMRFLNRPLSMADDGLSRAYLLRQHDRVFGYVVLNPWFQGGRVAGYLLDILRCEPTRQWGVFYAVVDSLAAALTAEGRDGTPLELSLGFCPLYQATAATAEGPHYSPVLSAQVGVLERYLAEVPYVRRLRELKDSLPGRNVHRYFASYTGFAPLPFSALLGACGVSLSSILGPGLWRSIWVGLLPKKDGSPNQ